MHPSCVAHLTVHVYGERIAQMMVKIIIFMVHFRESMRASIQMKTLFAT